VGVGFGIMPSLINAFKEDAYRIGPAQAILYDRSRLAIFPEGFVGSLYDSIKGSRFSTRREDSLDTLTALFCGFTDLSWDSVTLFLLQRPLITVGVWDGDQYEVAGFGFPTDKPVGQPGDRMIFGGYCIFSKWWGKPEAEALTMLGLCAMFGEWELKAIHGVRYPGNNLTARFMRKFGFKDMGQIDDYMLRNGKLGPAIASSLKRETFEQYLERTLSEYYAEQRGQASLFDR